MKMKNRAIVLGSNLDRSNQVLVGKDKLNWWREFSQRWKDCQRCDLHQFRERICHFRGIIPAKICFIGEAPGVSEDEKGLPFWGPAGKLLDELMARAGLQDGDFCLVNTVGCIPYPPGDEISQPPARCVNACSSRLEDLVVQINPKLIVLVGKIAVRTEAILDEIHNVPRIYLIHPSAILRGSPTQRIQNEKRFVLTIQEALSKHQISLHHS